MVAGSDGDRQEVSGDVVNWSKKLKFDRENERFVKLRGM